MKKTAIYNELNEDIKVGWDLKGDNPRTFTLISKEITHIPEKYADHVKRQLANRVFDVKYSYRKNRDMQLKEIYKTMEPDI